MTNPNTYLLLGRVITLALLFALLAAQVRRRGR